MPFFPLLNLFIDKLLFSNRILIFLKVLLLKTNDENEVDKTKNEIKLHGVTITLKVVIDENPRKSTR